MGIRDILASVDAHIKYAESRLDEEIRNDGEITYWLGRLEEARSIRKALEVGGSGNG